MVITELGEGGQATETEPALSVFPAKRRVKIAKANSVSIYCVELELALTELLGPKGKWRGLAGAFKNHLRVRSAILDATRVLQNRLDSILTADDRLRLTNDCHLDEIKRLAKVLKADGGGVLPFPANFIHLTAVLLGFDWLSGRPNRGGIYYQTLAQQIIDDEGRHPNSNFLTGKLEHECRSAFTIDLRSREMGVSQIARILNQSESFIKNILAQEGVIDRWTHIKRT